MRIWQMVTTNNKRIFVKARSMLRAFQLYRDAGGLEEGERIIRSRTLHPNEDPYSIRVIHDHQITTIGQLADQAPEEAILYIKEHYYYEQL